MYAYFAKGMTVGHVLTRLVLREITSVPGIMLDFMFAIFWIPDYTSYWAENSAFIEYADGTRHTGVMRALFGWIGELLGFVVGGTVGSIIGTALFFPDLLIRGLFFLKEKVYNSVDDFAVFIGTTSFFEELFVYDRPTSYLEKAWNLGSATLGMAIAVIPYIAAKLLEFVFPFLSPSLSYPVAVASSTLGGLLGWSLAAIIAPPLYLLEKGMDLIKVGRDTALKAIALVYAKSGHTPIGPEDWRESCVPPAALHSEAFRKQVGDYARTPWARLLFGPSKEQQPPRRPVDRHVPTDPITQEALGANGIRTVIDRQGHTFNDYRGTTTQGIHFWVNRNHSCPLDRETLYPEDLVPNRDFDALRAQHPIT